MLFDPEARSNHWSINQVEQVDLVQALRHSDVPLGEIAGASCCEDDLLSAAYLKIADDIRRTRRTLKAIVHRQNQLRGVHATEGIENLYARYIPGRWLAMVPASGSTPSAIDVKERTHLFAALKKLVEVVGWSFTYSYGQIISMSADCSCATRYVFAEVATPPMPAVPRDGIIDAGCYRAFDETGASCDCNHAYTEEHCSECARFGREPRKSDWDLWHRAQKEYGQAPERTLGSNAPKLSYEYGIWSRYAKERLGQTGDTASREHPKKPGFGRMGIVALKPRLMPQETALPMGAMVCALPAGFYLCRQTADAHCGVENMIRVASGLERSSLSLEDEMRIARENARAMAGASHREGSGAPSREPFAMPRSPSDPLYEGWLRVIGESPSGKAEGRQTCRLEDLKLLEESALPPEDGFCIVLSRTPNETDPAHSWHEIQVLVDPSTLIERRPPATPRS